MMQHRGITLLLSVFIMGIALTVAVGIFNIFLGELLLAGESSKSIAAFFAADAGNECALYWDRKVNSFTTSNGPGSNSINCGGSAFNVGGWDSCTPTACTRADEGKDGSSTFVVSLSNGSCAEVTVEKTHNVSNQLLTSITSLGRNDCLPGAPRVVERGLEVRFIRP